MNLLSNLYNADDWDIIRLNRKYIMVILVIILVIIALLFIEKKNYYQNYYDVSEEKIMLLVENDIIGKVQNSNEISIDDIKDYYSIENITLGDEISIIAISLKTPINDISHGVYKIYLGKERLFDYIIRIIKK